MRLFAVWGETVERNWPVRRRARSCSGGDHNRGAVLPHERRPMAAISEETVLIRQIQGLTALLCCLPAGGKARELFTLALALDEGPWLEGRAP
jgi:hypothetical protein